MKKLNKQEKKVLDGCLIIMAMMLSFIIGILIKIYEIKYLYPNRSTYGDMNQTDICIATIPTQESPDDEGGDT